MSAATQNEMERLRAERDAMQQQLNDALEQVNEIQHGLSQEQAAYDSLNDILDKVKAERDAALEREAALGVIVKEMQQLADDDPCFREHLGRDLVELLSASSTTSLTRHTLLAQAEALKSFREQYELHCDVPDFILGDLEETAEDLRQRANQLNEKE